MQRLTYQQVHGRSVPAPIAWRSVQCKRASHSYYQRVGHTRERCPVCGSKQR